MSITLVTPTYRHDYERFVLQRESLERCGVELPHVAIVNDQDKELFASVPFKRNLRLLSTADVLPPRLEARRASPGYRRLHPYHWIKPTPLHGWMAQQLVKLAVGAVLDTDAYLCLDSDACFIQKIGEEDFRTPDGRLHLYETCHDIDAEMGEFHIKSARFLQVPIRGLPIRRYIHAPLPMDRRIVAELKAYIENRYQQDWFDAILGHEMIFEYPTYGLFARHHHQLRLVSPVVPALSLYFWFQDEIEAIQHSFASRLQASPGAKLVLVNSNVGMPTDQYRRLIEGVWPRTPR